MKDLRPFRIAALYCFGIILLLAATFAAFSAAGPAASVQPGSTAQALALRAAAVRAALNPGPQLDARHAANGRWLYNKSDVLPTRVPLSQAAVAHAVGAHATTTNGLVSLQEPVQTFDILSPPVTGFVPLGTADVLTPSNQQPFWTSDQQYIVFISNRDMTGAVAADGHFHIWVVRSDGSTTPVQLTSGTGDETFPTVSSGGVLAFSSTANSPGNSNLYTIPFNPTATAPTNVVGLTDPFQYAKTLGDTGFENVQRPSWSPDGSRLVFAAATNNPADVNGGNGHYHLYEIYASSNGGQPTGVNPATNPPALLTDGPTDETDPAWAPNGYYIAFATTATSITPNPVATGTDLTIAQYITGGAGTNRNIWLISDGTLTLNPVQVTATGTDNSGPAWSTTNGNIYLNPSSLFDYLAFARGARPNAPHDIYYLQALTNPSDNTITVTPEGSAITGGTAGERDNAIQLNTDDPGNQYDDLYPTWSPFRSVYSISYESNRSISYNNPNTLQPSETAVSIAAGGTYPGVTAPVGAGYEGILQSQLFNLDPPTLLQYSGNEAIHVNAATSPNATPQLGTAGTHFISPSPLGGSSYATFTVRLSDREAGISNTGANGLPDVYLQIKDPDSKYQDSQGLEHKVFVKDNTYFQATDANNNLIHPLTDSGSASQLMNGTGNTGFNISPRNSNPVAFGGQRGAIAGEDRHSGTISIGHDNGGLNTINGNQIGPPGSVLGPPKYLGATTPDNNGIITNSEIGGSPDLWTPWGPEYECQYVNPSISNAGGNPFQTKGDYGTPYYLAGVDDQKAFTGYDPANANAQDFIDSASTDSIHPPRLAAPQPSNGVFQSDPNAQYLQLQKSPQQDGQGGVLYYATWRVPTAPSDFYLDVIAYDTARFPKLPSDTSSYASGQTALDPATQTDVTLYPDNWRIFDNIAGFTTATFNGSNDILVVSDNALGQKFVSFTFNGQAGSSNLLSKQFGAESYVTDVDINILPNSVYYDFDFSTVGGSGQQPVIQRLFVYNYGQPGGGFGQGVSPYYTDILNGLGVGSYYDGIVGQDGTKVDGVPDPQSQRYSLWRILSRGPIDPAVLKGYQPTTVTQPAVADTGANVTAPTAKVTVANRCVIWLSPFAGDLVYTSGTITDTSTQQTLENFVNGNTTSGFTGGGRLCVTGQTVASALSGSTSGNTFLTSVLNAKLVNTPFLGGGNQLVNGSTKRITGNAQSDGAFALNFGEFKDGWPNPNTFVDTPPSQGQHPLLLGNDFGNPFDAPPNWRADGSLDQIGPSQIAYGNSTVLGAPDVIQPNTAAETNAGGLVAHVDSTYGAGDALIYTDHVNADTAIGGKVVFSAFGLEGLSTDCYVWFSPIPTGIDGNHPHFSPYNKRQNVLHNIVDYLRTGTISGRIVQTSGQTVAGVSGATVYLTGGTQPAGARAVFSAITDSSGNYTISGVEPGTYGVSAYKTGYFHAASRANVTVEGDTSSTESPITLQSQPNGTITGKVTSASGTLINGATVTFKSTDGTTTVTGVTGGQNGNGVYSISVPPNTYTGTATDPPSYGTSPTSATVTVTSGATVTGPTFVLPAAPGTISGLVTDQNGVGIVGATVTFTAGGKVVGTTTTGTGGSYVSGTLTGSATGTVYTITAVAAGYSPNSVTATLVGGAITAPTIVLTQAANGTIGGLITDPTGNPLSGATVTITDTATGATLATYTTTAPFTATAPGTGTVNYEGPVQSTTTNETFTVTASDGTTYTVASLAGVTVTAGGFTRVDLQLTNPATLHTFTVGYNFFSLPYEYPGTPDPETFFNSLFGALDTATSGAANGNRSHVSIYDTRQHAYVVDPTYPADGIHLGRGYWVYLFSPVSLNTKGTAPTASTVSIPLYGSNTAGRDGWNMIGVPSTTAIPVSSLSFTNPAGGTPLTFAQASTATGGNLVSPLLYTTPFVNGSYTVVTSTGTLQPYQAYWIHANADTTILIPTGMTTTGTGTTTTGTTTTASRPKQ